MKSFRVNRIRFALVMLALSGAVIPPNYDYQARAQTVTQEKRSQTTWGAGFVADARLLRSKQIG